MVLYNESPNGKCKDSYLKQIRKIVGGSEEVKETGKGKKLTQQAKNEAFNRKISAQIDQDLKDYVKDFRRKVTIPLFHDYNLKRWRRSSKNQR